MSRDTATKPAICDSDLDDFEEEHALVGSGLISVGAGVISMKLFFGSTCSRCVGVVAVDRLVVE